MEVKGTLLLRGRSSHHLLTRIAYMAGGIVGLVLLAIASHDFGAALQGPGAQRFTSLSLLACYFLYMVLMIAQWRWSPWPRRRLIFVYLMITFTLALVTGMFASPVLRLVGYISIGAVLIQARSALGKAGLGLIGGVLIPTISWYTLFPDEGIVLPVASLPVGLWLMGLALLQTFTVLVVQERITRVHNEQLISLLMVTQQQLRASAARAEELAATRERMRVAREVHDTLAQGLAAIKMHLETSTRLLDPQQTRIFQQLEQARMLAGEYLAKTRQTIAALRTDAVQEQPLTQLLAQIATIWQERGLIIHVDMSAQARLAAIPAAIAHAYARIAEEALNNAWTHGHARHVEIELSLEAETLCLAITDDGTGFEPAPPESYAQSGHFGIVGMYERAHAVQGRLDLISAPEMGTQVMVTAPLRRDQEEGGPDA